ncbi:hypothetical protein O3G_MSEX002281 [Manduca sexta]|uniref:Aromatic amino acid beta-eliminating lyase/threonine aldolase domain-containing protein n=1 Tax=Manduca sexta TaxID=7130 RepID=A0A921YNH5_MANSE|nr:hypothetical protein O3G_MSEX002281 [Manduca sexta]
MQHKYDACNKIGVGITAKTFVSPFNITMVHCNKRGSEAIVGNLSHIYKYEVGGAAHVAGVLLSTVANKPDGTFDLEELERRIRGDNIHEPITSMVAVENTHNVCGGKALPLKFLDDLGVVCKKYSLPLHMDGARLFNASEYLQVLASRVVRDCDSVSVCFSKGLSAPVGSVLVGTRDFIEQARRIRKMLGGGMRQAGVLAAAVLVGLDEMMPQLYLDHQRARRLACAIRNLGVDTFSVDDDVHTNIVLVYISPASRLVSKDVVKNLAQSDEDNQDCRTANNEDIVVKASSFGPKIVRLTLHKDISDQDLSLAINKISYVFRQLDRHRVTSKL